MTTNAPVLERLSELERMCTEAGDVFLAGHDAVIADYRKMISSGIDAALASVREHVRSVSGANEGAARLAEHLEEYVSWMQWSLWDLPVLAVALKPAREEFHDTVVACGLVFISIRLFDDAIDHHYCYKGRHDTLLGTLTEMDPRKANGLSILAGLLLCFEGLERLGRRDEDGGVRITAVLRSVRDAVIGAIVELGDSVGASLDEYLSLVRLKNVDYCRSLYASLDPTFSSPLCPFMMGFYELAQFLNDVEDHAEDLRLGQPNLVVIHQRTDDDGFEKRDVPVAVEQFIAERFLALGDQIADLPPLEASVAQLKLADAFRSARAARLFAGSGGEESLVTAPSRPELYPYSELSDVVERVGGYALSRGPCAVCGCEDGRTLFRKQGFPFVRCAECTHIYPNPRMAQHVLAAVASECDTATHDGVSSLHGPHAEFVCELLVREAAGGRLLEIGCGHGQFLRVAQLYGFDVLGLDHRSRQLDALQVEFGERIAPLELADVVIPWRELDVVLLTHVLQLVTDPTAFLVEARDRIQDDGLVYVTVADFEGSSFRLLGKRWDIVNPMTSLHYFTEVSLTTLLQSAGFESIERVHPPGPPEEISPRWVRLMRRVGYDELDELCMLARVPARGPS